jgi:HAD superfamily hydrolase (TIGR01509 family)
VTLKALIFDVDGTLAETEEAHREAFNRVFVEWGLDWHWSQPLYRDLLQTTGGKERIRAWQDRLPNDAPRLRDADIARIHLEKTAIYTGILATGGLELRTGVAELIEAARAEGLRLAVATTTNMPNVAALTRCCWSAAPFEVFDVIAAGDEVEAKKPAPDVFELALERLGLPPGACIAFEDSLNGLISARGAGLRVVVTPSIYTDDQDFSQAQLVTGNLAQLGLGDLAALLADEVAQ